MMDDVDRIVAGLSQSQRQVILHNYIPSPRVGGRIVAATMRMQRDLHKKGLCGSTGAISPTGLRVRARLAEVQS